MGDFRKLIKRIEQARRLAFPKFDRITLSPKAVQILANLFLNPDCRSDIDLTKFAKDKPVKLNQISAHIITAAPNTLAKYAQDHYKVRISESDILKCFALDHAKAIQENRIDIKLSPSYGLAHLLNISRVIKIKEIQEKKFIDLEKRIGAHTIIFKNVLVPDNLQVFKNQEVFHHFGIVVAAANTPRLIKLVDKIKREQKKEYFIYKMNQGVTKERKLIINTQDKADFHENLMEKIIVGNKKIKPPQPNLKDISKGKVIFSK